MCQDKEDAGDGSNQRTSSALAEQRCWSSLYHDLLGEVYVRLAGPLDRACFAVVCTSWHAVALAHPPPRALPWLMLDPLVSNEKKCSLYCPQDGTILPRLPLRADGAGGYFVGCHEGGWVTCSEPPFTTVNLFTAAEIVLPQQKTGMNEYRLVFRKTIFSEAPTSNGCIVAAITHNHDVAVCRPSCPEGGWILIRRLYGQSVLDIAFCNGELFVLTSYKELNKFVIGMHEDGTPFFKAIRRMAPQNSWIFTDEHGTYIIELCGKIVMAVRRTQSRRPFSRNISGPFFAVFELVDTDKEGATTDLSCKWVEVSSLGDHALFLAPTCSKAVHVPTDRHGYPRRNHIYYSHHRCFTPKNQMPRGAKEFLRSSDDNGCHLTYYKEDERIVNDIEGIMSVGYYMRGGTHPPMWIFPPDL